MTPIVEQLQRDALDREVPVSDLLRKAKVVAVKLGLDEAVEWVEFELGGYPDHDRIPDYRELAGQPRGFNPYQGWLPIMFTGDDRTQELISTRKLGDSISELEHLVRGEGQLYLPFASSQIALLAEALEIEPIQMALFIGRDKMVGILDAVRNRVLDWALELEKAGIRGDAISFSPKEKAAASNPSVIYNIGHIGNVSGAMGPVSGDGTVTSTQINSLQVSDLHDLVEQIDRFRDSMALTEHQNSELTNHVVALRSELVKEQPNHGKIAGLLKSIKNVVEGASGNVVGTGVASLIHKILSSI